MYHFWPLPKPFQDYSLGYSSFPFRVYYSFGFLLFLKLKPAFRLNFSIDLVFWHLKFVVCPTGEHPDTW